MPQASFDYDESDKALLERVRRRYHLQDCQQAAEWLIKARLRRATRRLAGRGRALYPIREES